MRRWGRTHLAAVAVAAAVMTGNAPQPARADGDPIVSYWWVGSGTAAAATVDWAAKCSPVARETGPLADLVPDADSVFHDLRRYPHYSLRVHWQPDLASGPHVVGMPDPEVAMRPLYLWARWVYTDCTFSDAMRVDQLMRYGHDVYVPWSARGVVFWSDEGTGRVRLHLAKVPM